jgi:hypothetical protein
VGPLQAIAPGPVQAIVFTTGPILAGVSGKGGQGRTLGEADGPVLAGVRGAKGGQDRTVAGSGRLETPAQRAARTPAQTPAAYVRAGKEPQNQGTSEHPPSPPEGGLRPGQVVIEEHYVTERGRRRTRLVCVDLDAVRRGLRAPTSADEDDWRRVRAVMRERVGESVFEIWLDPLQLIGLDGGGALVVTAPVQMLAWLSSRWGELITGSGEQVGRAIRFADEKERVAIAGRDSESSPLRDR